jgi:hypothetical protein
MHEAGLSGATDALRVNRRPSVDWLLNTVDWKLNIVDLIMLGVTIVIAWLVWRWDKRNSADALLWDSVGAHWRSAIALLEDDYGPGKDKGEEIEKRRLYIARTVRQIRMLDGTGSKLAGAFEAIKNNSQWDWDNSTNTVKRENADLINELTYRMAKRFGSRKARKSAKRRLRNSSA